MSKRGPKAIETQFKGYRFRSRLEARWAVFFDALGIQWEYEKEGYDLQGCGRYLPDFWLTTVNMWAEVKPQEFSEAEKDKCKRLAIETGYPCLMLAGAPEVKRYWAMEPDGEGTNEAPDMCDYALSNYHDYPQEEHRFFVSLGFDETDPCFREYFGDMEPAVLAARQARFEHGEQGEKLPW